MHNLLRKIRRIFNKRLFSNILLIILIVFFGSVIKQSTAVFAITVFIFIAYSCVMAYICDKQIDTRLTDDNYDKTKYKNLD